MTNVNDLVRDHVTLTVECLDHIYLNAYIPTLQTPGQLVNFVVGHQGNKIPSPALQGRLTDDFKAQIQSFAEQGGIPIVHFAPGQREDDIATEGHQRFDRAEGVIFIGVAQEETQAFKGREKDQTGYVGCGVWPEALQRTSTPARPTSDAVGGRIAAHPLCNNFRLTGCRVWPILLSSS